jgi:hypothetical protein
MNGVPRNLWMRMFRNIQEREHANSFSEKAGRKAA